MAGANPIMCAGIYAICHLPALIVPRGDAVYDLKTGTENDVKFHLRVSRAQFDLGRGDGRECIDGYMVVQNGEVLFERYYDNFRAQPSHLVFHDQIAHLNRFRHCASRVWH